jgi:DeoD family purine-nucleoside phosphorylase
VNQSALHLRPTAPLAERVLLPGDPGRALALAQSLLTEPKMFNHHRGLWGYTGGAPDGAPLTIQSTGMGGPSAAIVLEELIDLGVRAAVRVGTCGALDPALGLGDLVLAREAIAADGTSRALGFTGRVAGDERLAGALADAHRQRTGTPTGAVARPGRVLRAGAVVSTDLFYDPDPGRNPGWARDGALAVEMECAPLYAVAARRGVAAGCLLTVSDCFPENGGRERIDDDRLLEAAEAMGAIAIAALRAGGASAAG